MMFHNFSEQAEQLDASDPLKNVRTHFHHPIGKDGRPKRYFAGHSLGLCPVKAESYIAEAISTWQTEGVAGHFNQKHPWFSYHELVTRPLARLTGAQNEEVIAMGSLTSNLHHLLQTFYRPTPQRYKIIIEAGAFPSDRYAVKSQIELAKIDPQRALIEVGTAGEVINPEMLLEIIEREGPATAVVLLGGVQYLTGQAFPVEKLCKASHAQGALFGLDLAHAIGNIPLQLSHWEVDFAVWCHYKYLNAGPGAIGGGFVNRRHTQNSHLLRPAGWWGHNKTTRFAMPHDFDPIPSAEGFQLSNPPIFQLAALRASLEIFDAVNLDAYQKKAQTAFTFMTKMLHAAGAHIVTPQEDLGHGQMVCVKLPQLTLPERAQFFLNELEAKNIVVDFRQPNILRFTPAALYCSYRDIYEVVSAIDQGLRFTD